MSLLGSLMLWLSSRQLGVWELGEFTHIKLLDWMWAHETWMQVNIPTAGMLEGDVRVAPELAPGWWPSLITWGALRPLISPVISDETCLRLPHLILGGLITGALYEATRVWRASRFVAIVSSALLLITPTLVFGERHALASGGVGASSATLAALALFNIALRPRMTRWWVVYLITWVMSATSLGAFGLLYPLALMLSSRELRDIAWRHRLSIFGSLSVITLIYWRSWMERASGVDFWSLYVTIDPLTHTYRYADWGGFQNTLHLLGFGLFPLGALIPVIPYTLRAAERAPRLDGSNRVTRGVADLSLMSLMLGFFPIALLAPEQGIWGGAATLCAPTLALGAAILLVEGHRERRATTLHLFAVILFALLITRGIKHNPSLILSVLSGADAESALPELATWPSARLLALTLFGWLVLYQTSLVQYARRLAVNLSQRFTRSASTQGPSGKYRIGRLRRRVRSHDITRTSAGLLHPLTLLCGALGGAISLIPEISQSIPRWVVAHSLVLAPFWGKVGLTARLVALTLLGFTLSYWAAHLTLRFLTARAQRAQRVELSSHTMTTARVQVSNVEWWMWLELAALTSFIIITPHYLTRLSMWRFMRPLIGWMEQARGEPLYTHVIIVHLWLIVVLWALLVSARHLQVTLHNKAHASARDHLNARLFSFPGVALRGLIHPATTLVALLSLLLSFHLFAAPREIGEQMSHRGLIERYKSFKRPNDQLAIYGVRDAWRGYYLRDLSELSESQLRLATRDQDHRTLMIIERDQLSKLNKRFREITQQHLPILDDEHHQLRLAATRLESGEEDRNPIRRAVIDELPKDAQKLPEPINFEGRVELVGWRVVPKVLRRGRPARVQLFWRVKRRIYGQWKVFVHIDDPPRGQRIHGDHDPVEGLYPTQDWRVGDLISDEHTIKLSSTLKPASFIFYTGLYRGKTRMKIKNTSNKLKDKDNRANIGRVKVQ